MGVSPQPLIVHFALTLGVALLVRLRLVLQFVTFVDLFNETIQINQTLLLSCGVSFPDNSFFHDLINSVLCAISKWIPNSRNIG